MMVLEPPRGDGQPGHIIFWVLCLCTAKIETSPGGEEI